MRYFEVESGGFTKVKLMHKIHNEWKQPKMKTTVKENPRK